MAPINDRHKLLWSHPSTPAALPSLPTGITRTFIPTPLGPLELLIAQPKVDSDADTRSQPHSQPRKKALLFQHGGFGFAALWIDYMLYFSALGHPCYALSLRGHGASWKPGYFRMVWGYGKADFAQDLGYAVTFVSGLESGLRGTGGGDATGAFKSEDLVLVGHSAGGGLSQYFLGKGSAQVGALVIVAAFPCFGGYGVYWRWFKNDPWFAPRYYIRDLWHSRSPLSSTTLVHRAFFSPAFPRAEVQKFEPYLCEYESMLWPLGMMLPFVNTRGVVRNVLGWEQGGKRILVVAGERDKLMGVGLMWKMASVYRGVVQRLMGLGNGDRRAGWFGRRKALQNERKEKLVKIQVDSDGEEEDDYLEEERVGFEVVSESGHHLQNDLHWEEGATKILKFLKQL